MKTLKIYGASDDLLEVEGVDGADEFNVYPSGHYVGYLRVEASDGKMNVHVIYDGAWSFSISPQDGDQNTLPGWKTEFMWGTETPYSWTVTIEVPDDTVVTLKPKK